MIKLVAGLGNPDEKYRGTRHNAGFDAVDAFVKTNDGIWKRSIIDGGKETKLTPREGIDIRVVKPFTSMNNSGVLVGPLARYYKIAPEEVLVVYDDFTIPLGQLRIRERGSHGGHNGLKSCLAYLKKEDVPRLRLGIGPAPEDIDPIKFVLDKFKEEELELYKKMVDRAAEAISMTCVAELAKSMNHYNAKK